jgi:outer membrane protein TolC
VLNSLANHPELRQYTYKLKGFHIEKTLKFQLLLPEVKLRYNQLGTDFSKAANAAWFSNNYNYGITVSMPLRLSEGRGEYAKAKIKIENIRIQQENKQVQLQLKVKQYFTEWQQTLNQLSIQNNLVKNFAGLQKAEEIRFSNGESNLFLINARELRTIEAEQKMIELKSKNRQAHVRLQWSAGLLIE